MNALTKVAVGAAVVVAVVTLNSASAFAGRHGDRDRDVTVVDRDTTVVNNYYGSSYPRTVERNYYRPSYGYRSYDYATVERVYVARPTYYCQPVYYVQRPCYRSSGISINLNFGD